MANITMRLLDELTKIVRKKIKKHKDYLLDSHKKQIEKETEKKYIEMLENYHIDTHVQSLGEIEDKIEAISKLLKTTEAAKTELSKLICKILDEQENFDKLLQYYGPDNRVTHFLRKFRNKAKEESIYAIKEIGPTIKKLDEMDTVVRDNLLLSGTNTAMQKAVQELVEKIDKISKID